VNNRARFLGPGLLLPIALVSGALAAEKTPVLLAHPVAVNQARLLKGTSDPHQWSHYGGSYSEQRFSPLKKINSQNVKDLGLAWYGDYDTNQNQHGSPLYVDGVIYVSTSRNVVHAFDAKTGKRLWTYNPVIHGERVRYNVGLVNRGIAAFDGKIYMGTLDARLIAIDAKTGKAVWDIDTVPASLGLGADMTSKYSITMAPRVAKGKVFIGDSGGEFGVRGFIAAFDAQTGKEAWRFWTVPGDPAKGPDHAASDSALARATSTWNGEFWKNAGGGGTVWDAAVYDPVTDLLYFGTGNGSAWNSQMRDGQRGDNLYVASIVAVKADSGEYVWHYQETPGDSWDYDAISPMMTADLNFKGQKKHVILQPSKNGMMYVIEAANGKLISGDAFTEVNWNTGVDLKTGRPIEVPGARYETEAWNVAPGAPGGHTWHQNAFSPETGLVYIPTWENYGTMTPQVKPANGPPPLISFGGRVDRATLKPNNRTSDNGWLRAWDPVARKVVWETEKGPRATSGVLATGGNLVFMGNSAGKHLNAFDAKTGAKLWDFDAQTAVFASPITYELDGKQYIAASVGGTATGGYFAPTYARMLVFAIGGKTTLPPNQPYTPPVLNPPPSTASADVITHGAQLYDKNCSVCHGVNGTQQRTSFPNLTLTPLLYVQEGFDQVVLGGLRTERGMGSFAKELKPEDTVAVRAYLISRANEVKNQPPVPPGGPGAGRRQPDAAPAPATAPAPPTTPAPTAPAPTAADAHAEPAK
jgi:quinohemoprotein ethanol dehydrogenase